MDKVKLALAVVKKHYFWATSAAVVLLALISWTKATADLAGRFQERKTKLDHHFDEMHKISEQADHPNAAVIQALATKKEDLEKKVLEAWQVLFDQQKAKNQLPDVLSDEFKKAFDELKPGVELPEKLREHYLIYIHEHIPKLFDIVQLLQPAGEKKEKSGRKSSTLSPRPRRDIEDPRRQPSVRPIREGAEAADTGMVGVVAWDEADRRRIEDRYQWPKAPSTAKVLAAQEDLWVYEALLRVIKNTNGDAKNNYDAAVKRIELLQIGAEVANFSRGAAAGTLSRPEVGGASPSGATENLLEGRYVDGNFNPLAAGAPPPFAEFKMVPVRMQLVVQQQKIPKLLVECANSTMPIEPRAVHLWPGAGPSLDLSAPAAAPGADASGRETFGHTLGRPSGRSESAAAGQQEDNPKDVPIEIEGIVYIYSPPDKAKLGTGAGSQAAPVEGVEGEAAPESPGEPTEPAEPADATTALPPAPPAAAMAGAVPLAAAVRLSR